MRFGKEQLNAIEHVNGPMMVIAGPGSGKTTVITQRVKYLIESAGVNPADILVITFTKAAAHEMESRFKILTKGNNYHVRFGTFHSIFFWIIKTAYNISNSSVISEDDKKKLIDKIINDMNYSYENREDVIANIISQISLVKCDMLDITYYYSKDMPAETFRSIYLRLENEMKRLGKIDFDDMMVMCYELLQNREDILNKCRDIFKYILVDEFQDCNKIQYEIFKLLAKPKENAFIVGDDDQSVYGFRGARPEIMQQFKKDFSKAKQVFLGDNYRCDRNITKASAAVIDCNKNRFKKKLVSMSANDGIVKFLYPKNDNEANQLLIKQIKDNYAKGIAYERQAIIYRTNIQPRKLVYKLNQFNIPYTISDSMPNIFEHFVIKNILDYMRIAMGDNSRAVFLRILNKPSRYISRESLMEDPVDYDKLRWRLRDKDYAVDNLDKFMADIKLIKKMRPFPALNFIRKSIGYDAYIKEYSEYRQLDYNEFMDILDEFASMIIDMTSYGELFEFIDDYTQIMIMQHEKNNIRTGLNLMTMHSSKGLEFDCVYIIDALEGMTPYKKATSVLDIEEERRMFYVAMTRAKHQLYIYSPSMHGNRERDISRFVKEAEN